MVQATRWLATTQLEPMNPYQRIRFAPTFPSGSGNVDSAFGWVPQAGPTSEFRLVGSPNGFTNVWGLSGLRGGLGLSLDVGGLLRGLFALTGIGFGLWLAKKNLEK